MNLKSSVRLSKQEKLERQILQMLPLSKLPLDSRSRSIHKAIHQLKTELKGKGLDFNPIFWISTEWFCPDGICGVAIPFYLFNRTLLDMEREKTQMVEGETYSQLLKLLRHEVGHAFENLYGTRNYDLRTKTFGSSRRRNYPSSYKPKLYSRNYIRHLGDGYAQSHPDEDFAETFAVWLANPKAKLQKKYAKQKALQKKIQALDLIIREAVKRGPLKSCKFKPYEPIEKNHQTLCEYYRNKIKRHKLSLSRESKAVLRQSANSPVINSGNRGGRGPRGSSLILKRVLVKRKSHLISELSEHLGLYRYQVARILRPMEKVIADGPNVILCAKKDQPLNILLDALTLESLESLRLKKDRVYL